jgi:hypothetical protein
MDREDFQVGGVYQNRNGDYEVVRRSGDHLDVIYDDGTPAELNASTQARIARNMSIEAGALAPFADADRNEAFFENVGFFATNTSLIEGFGPGEAVPGFARVYEQLTGRQLSRESTFYDHGAGADKWGVELRIEFAGDAPNPDFGFGASPVGSPKGPGVSRINNNALIRRLFALGFVFGVSQSLDRIKDRVPRRFRDAFARGALPRG